MKYKTVLLDMDGTLTDNCKGIQGSFRYALEHLGMEHPSEESLGKVVGPPLAYSFSAFFGLSDEDTEKAVALYREFYKVQGIKENVLYPGVKEMFSLLKKAGCQIYVASSKLEESCVRIMDRFGLTSYLDGIVGSCADCRRSEKKDVIEYALKLAGIDEEHKSQAVMVGDRFYDIEGAHEAGISCIAVLYGFGNMNEFQQYKADYIANSPEEVAKLILESEAV